MKGNFKKTRTEKLFMIIKFMCYFISVTITAYLDELGRERTADIKLIFISFYHIAFVIYIRQKFTKKFVVDYHIVLVLAIFLIHFENKGWGGFSDLRHFEVNI